MDHVRRFSWCGQRRRSHGTSWEVGVLMIWLALNCCDACLPSEASALLDIKSSSIDSSDRDAVLASWNESVDCCSGWVGVSCNRNTGAVSRLNLISSNFQSRLRISDLFAAVCNLTELRSLFMERVTFNSVFPPCLWNMKLLDLLDVRFANMKTRPVQFPTQGVRHLKVLRFENFADGLRFSNWKDLFHFNSSLVILNLVGCDLYGTLPPSIGNATKLSELDLSTNHFAGELPETLGELSRLRYLSLGRSLLSGRIPPSIGNLKLMEGLHLSDSELVGEIPYELGNLGRLSVLDLSNNNLNGSIPQSFAGLYNLVQLNLGYNELRGPIPEWIGGFSQLEVLRLEFNRLSGSFPASLGNLRNLTELNLERNKRVTGELPSSLGTLTRMETLILAQMSLTGELPSGISNFSSLVNLNVSHNRFGGGLPDFKELVQLQFLSLGNNRFSGEIRDSLGRLSLLSQLDLSRNKLSGPIPETIGNITEMAIADLSNNALSGRLPEALLSLERLWTLSLANNWLPGSIPQWLVNMTALTALNLSSNSLSGDIPEIIFSWPGVSLDFSSNNLTGTLHPLDRLHKLYLSRNKITGHLPLPSNNASQLGSLDLSFNSLQGSISSLVNYPELYEVLLFSNHFTGLIPASIGSLHRLRVLNLGNNDLQGPIPSSFGDMTKLEMLKLCGNQLTGEIPYSMGNLKLMESLDLSDNRLTGEIPATLGTLKKMKQLKLQRNSLSGSIPTTFCVHGMQLYSISLSYNQLSGKIPDSLGYCNKLKVLDLGSNRFHGRLPVLLRRRRRTLRVLLVGSNQLRGRFPSWMVKFMSLQVLDISNNSFTGRIPYKLGHLQGFVSAGNVRGGTLYDEDIQVVWKGEILSFNYVLKTLASIDVSNNKMNGTIPKQLGNLRGLKSLNLSGNAFEGRIPSSLGNISQLESLDLSLNELSGSIPQELASISFLQIVNFSHNHLKGRIPQEGQFRTFQDPSCFEGNLQLCGPPLEDCDNGPTGISDFSRGRLRNNDINQSDPLCENPGMFLQGFQVGFCIGFGSVCLGGVAYFIFCLCYVWVNEWRDDGVSYNTFLCSCFCVRNRGDERARVLKEVSRSETIRALFPERCSGAVFQVKSGSISYIHPLNNL